MADPTHLHIYQCPNDATLAASTIRFTERALECVLCRTWMKYRWSEPIETPVQRDIAAHGVMFNPYVPRTELKR